MDVADTGMMDVSGSDLISIPPCDGALSVTKVERDCGQLSHLYANRVAVSFNQFSPRNLRELSLLSLPKDFLPTWTQFREVLLANESTLEVLEVDFVPSSKNDWQPFTLRKLTCLIFTFTQVKQLYRLVNTLRVPNLDYLSIMDGPRSIAFPITYDTPRQDTLLSCLLALIEHFPLSRIRHLTLSHLWFSPEDEMVSGIANAKNLVINRFVFDFFSALTSLEILTLASPTTVPLDILNYVPVDDSSPPTPMPCLRELELTLFNKHVVRDFLDTFGSAECREVRTIHLTMPLEWQDDMYLDVRYLCREPDVEFVYLKRLFPMLESPPSYWLCQYPARRLFDLDLF
ncbi:hypothetical protein H0H93_013114 [Arthromyces matolae]|nr:hypothetical protein H0H93_013114 [Arthromyces matolae]